MGTDERVKKEYVVGGGNKNTGEDVTPLYLRGRWAKTNAQRKNM